jgi:hypothetical protein
MEWQEEEKEDKKVILTVRCYLEDGEVRRI